MYSLSEITKIKEELIKKWYLKSNNGMIDVTKYEFDDYSLQCTLYIASDESDCLGGWKFNDILCTIFVIDFTKNEIIYKRKKLRIKSTKEGFLYQHIKIDVDDDSFTNTEDLFDKLEQHWNVIINIVKMHCLNDTLAVMSKCPDIEKLKLRLQNCV
jgi:hypothetical protein